MATQANPWDAFPAAGQGAVQPIIPRQPAPVRPITEDTDQERLAQMRAAGDRAARDEARRTAAAAARTNVSRARHGMSAQEHSRTLNQYQALPAFGRSVAQLEGIYRERLQGAGRGDIMGGGGDSNVRALQPYRFTGFRSFDTTSRNLVGAIANIYGTTGGEMNSLAELEARFGPFLPSSTDDDETIETKISNLYRIFNEQRGNLETRLGIERDPNSPGSVEMGANFGGDNEGLAQEAGVGFYGDATPPEPSGSPGSGSFRSQLEDGVRSGRIQNADQFFTLAERLNPALAARLPRANIEADLAQFRRLRARNPETRYEIGPFFEPDSDPITDARGGQGGGNPAGMTGALGIDGETVDAAVRGAADIPTIGLADEIAAAGDTIFGRGGTYGENLWRQRGIDEYDRQNHPYARLFGQGAASLALPTTVGRAAFGGVRNAFRSGATREVARTAGMRAGARRLGVEGSIFGGGYGFGSSDGNLGDRLASGGVSAAFGGAAGYGLGRGMGAVANRYGRTGEGGRHADRLEAFESSQAARELEIDQMPADVGGAFTRRATSAAAQFPFSAASVVNAGRRTIAQGQRARDRIADEIGEPMNIEAAGETARSGAQAFRSSSRQAVGRAYGRAEELAGDARIEPANARTMLDQNIAELGESPMGAPAALTSLRDRLEGDFTVSGLRGLRTQLRDEFGQQGLRGSDTERRAMQVVDALTDDIATGLTRMGRSDAAEAYRAADALHRERVQTIDNVIAPIIGRRGEKSGEEVVQSLQRAMSGNSVRARTFVDSLPAAERNTTRATLISQLGRSANSQQNADGNVFSLNTFLTNWNALQPSARTAVFGERANRSLTQLAQVANRSRQAEAFANRSNTGGVWGTGMTAGVGYAGWLPLLGAVMAQGVGGRLLASPVVARWMAREPANRAQTIAHIGRLSNIARTQPAIASEITGLQQGLLRQLGSDVGRAAASGEEE